MKKFLLIGLIFLAGCGSTLTIKPDGTISAKDYTVSIKADGTRTYVPNRWFTTGLLSTFFQNIGSLVK